jgi:3-dehydroquinate synthase
MKINYKINQSVNKIYITKNINKILISDLNKLNSDKKILFIYDKNIDKKIITKLITSLKTCGCKLFLLPLEGNKINKNEKSLFKIIDFLIEEKFTKNSIILTCSGGVIGDVSALASGLYLRGLIYLHIPTTITSIVDSCIGGKTAINYRGIINSIGSYYHAKSVYISKEIIESMPKKEFFSGIPEVIKCSLVKNNQLLKFLIRNKNKLLNRNFDVISKMCYETLKIKISLFQNDVYEKNTRLFLNFGHTFAHAIEMATDKLIKKDHFRHGEAVGLGILCEMYYSNKKKTNEYFFISKLLSDYNLPNKIVLKKNSNIKQRIHDEIYKGVFLDKKRIKKYPRYISLKKPGKPQIKEIDDYNLLNETIRTLFV